MRGGLYKGSVTPVPGLEDSLRFTSIIFLALQDHVLLEKYKLWDVYDDIGYMVFPPIVVLERLMKKDGLY